MRIMFGRLRESMLPVFPAGATVADNAAPAAIALLAARFTNSRRENPAEDCGRRDGSDGIILSVDCVLAAGCVIQVVSHR